MDEHMDYQSYLLRLWRTHSGGDTVWRASLEDPLTQHVVRFADVPSLVAFLYAQTGTRLPPPLLEGMGIAATTTGDPAPIQRTDA